MMQILWETYLIPEIFLLSLEMLMESVEVIKRSVITLWMGNVYFITTVSLFLFFLNKNIDVEEKSCEEYLIQLIKLVVSLKNTRYNSAIPALIHYLLEEFLFLIVGWSLLFIFLYAWLWWTKARDFVMIGVARAKLFLNWPRLALCRKRADIAEGHEKWNFGAFHCVCKQFWGVSTWDPYLHHTWLY